MSTAPVISNLLFVDGFLATPPQVPLKYNNFQWNGIGGSQRQPGPRGTTLGFSANGGSFWSVNFNAQQQTLGLHVDYKQLPYYGGVDQFTWFVIQDGNTPILSLKQINLPGYQGCIQVLGPGGALIGTSTIATVPGTWTNIILQVSFGASGSVSMWFNQAPVLANQPVTVNFSPYVGASSAGFQTYGNGPQGVGFANYILWDGKQYIGTCNVDGYVPKADSPQTAWFPAVTPPGVLSNFCYAMVDETGGFGGSSVPDGDVTYITPNVSQDQLFLMNPTQCYGLILGAAFSMCGKMAGQAPVIVDLLAQLSQGLQVIGSQTVAAPTFSWPVGQQHTPGYQTYQTCLPNSPATNTNWTDGELSTGNFGLGTNNTGVRITWFTLEKITSLGAYPFNCGAGASYAY